MKERYEKSKKPRLFISLIVSLFLLSSCDSFNFSHPQPFDKENIYQFPDEFLGKWREKDTTSYSEEKETTTEKEDSSYYYVGRNYVLVVIYEKKKVLAGEWPKLNDKNEWVYPPEGFGRLKEVKYDSLNNPVDTISKYIISNNKIYEIGENRFLYRGYNYTWIEDTITIHETDSVYIDLGQNAFLRKLSDSLYVLNINNSVLSFDELDNWWRLIILEMKADGNLWQWECNGKTGELTCMFYDRPSKSDIFFFDCQWSSQEILRLMREGYFEKSYMTRLYK